MSFLSRLSGRFKKHGKKSQDAGLSHECDDPHNTGQTPSSPVSPNENRSTSAALYLPSKSEASSSNGHTNPTIEPSSASLNILSNPHLVQFHNATFIENSMVAGGELVAMDRLRSHTDPNAAVDSSARQPPPTCHPKTRREIRRILTLLFDDERQVYRMVWLFGAAGTGKTAVGQTFSMKCLQKHRLGAAFFFSRPNRRNRYATVIATLAYQLATRCLPYRSVLIARVDYDSQILDKAPPVQLIKLIVEPMLEVRSRIRTTYLMVLDGVDECGENMEDPHEREREQCELVKMIADAVRDYPDLPLFWLLCSRPEHHLQKSYTNISTICRREELVIDAKCREEVEVVLREGFEKIAKDCDVISPGPEGWPSKAEFNKVERAVCGLHVFGAAILRDIGGSSNPVEQLKSLIPFLEHVAGAGPTRSIEDMDMFYIRILNDVPEKDLPTTLKIIGVLITMPDPQFFSVQALCNFLYLDPNRFFSALRKLHSVINIPSGEAALTESLQFYHASFSDFITDASRSKEFFIEKRKMSIDVSILCFCWHELHSNLFHSSDQPLMYEDDVVHDHEPLPLTHLTWITSAENHNLISREICRYAALYCYAFFEEFPTLQDERMLSIVHYLDLRHMSRDTRFEVVAFLNWVYEHDASSGLIRTGLESEEDRTLLTYLEMVTNKPVPPAQFPLTWGSMDDPYREYLLIGRGSQTIIICATGIGVEWDIMALNLDRKPDERTIQKYAAFGIGEIE